MVHLLYIEDLFLARGCLGIRAHVVDWRHGCNQGGPFQGVIFHGASEMTLPVIQYVVVVAQPPKTSCHFQIIIFNCVHETKYVLSMFK